MPVIMGIVLQVLEQYNQGIEARNRMLELILPGKVVFLRPRKVQNSKAIDHVSLHVRQASGVYQQHLQKSSLKLLLGTAD